MITTADLLNIALDRLTDAETLMAAHRYNGAVYLCGYAVEIALKYKICKSLNWTAFPATNKELESYRSLRTHDLAVLLSFTATEATVKFMYVEEWSAIETWNPEDRYRISGATNAAKAASMIKSAKKLIEIL